MSEKEQNQDSEDQDIKVLEHHDPGIEEKKPPNERITHYKIIKTD